jgi:Zinc knuckle
LIKEITYTFEERRKLSDALCDVKEHFYTFKQGRYMSLQRYHELFIAQAEVLEQVGVTIEDKGLVQSIAAINLRADPNNDDRAAAWEQALAIRFIRGTNENYKWYITHLRNSFLDQNDNYPTTLHQAYNILQRRELENPLPERDADGIAFTTTGTAGGSTNNGNDNNVNNSSKNRDHITCFECNQTGHYENQCPNKTQKASNDNQEQQQQGTNLFTYSIEERSDGFSFYQASK